MNDRRTLVVLQATPFCNIDCSYCYLPDRSTTTRMSIEVVRRVASEVFSSPAIESPITFLWHLGEPLAVPLAFYEYAFSEIAAINGAYKRPYAHSFQTNGTLLDDDWIGLIRRHEVQVGISLDGPAFIHDRCRLTRSHRGTHSLVLEGVNRLRRAGIDFGVIAVITDFTLDYPDEFFDFFVGHAVSNVAFNIDEIEGAHAATSFEETDACRLRYRKFLRRLLERSAAQANDITFREIWTNLKSVTLGAGEVQNTTNRPLQILNVKANGDYSTFAPELAAAKSADYHNFVMGNILRDGLADLPSNPLYLRVQREIAEGVARCEASCAYWNFCGGGSPASKFFEHGRFDVTETTTCRIHKQWTVDVLLEYLEDCATSKASPVEALP